MTKNYLKKRLKDSMKWNAEKKYDVRHIEFDKGGVILGVVANPINMMLPFLNLDLEQMIGAFFCSSLFLGLPFFSLIGGTVTKDIKNSIYHKAREYNEKNSEFYEPLKKLERKILSSSFEKMQGAVKSIPEIKLEEESHYDYLDLEYYNFFRPPRWKRNFEDRCSFSLPVKRVVGTQGRIKISKSDYFKLSDESRMKNNYEYQRVDSAPKKRSGIKYPFSVDLEDAYNQLSKLDNQINIIKEMN